MISHWTCINSFIHAWLHMLIHVSHNWWVSVRWLVFHSVWAKWTRGTGTLWLLYSFDPVLKYKLPTGMNSIRQIKLLIVNLFQSSTGDVGSKRQRQYFKLVLASFYLVQLMPQWAHFSHPAIICCTLWEIFGNVTTLSLFRLYIWDYVLIYAPVLNYVHTTHFHWHLKI